MISARAKRFGRVYTILERGTSADEQLQVWRDTGNIKAVVDRLIETTMEMFRVK